MHKVDSAEFFLVDDDATHFDKSLQELRDLGSELYRTAEYCEATFLAAEEKRIILENTKQYISRAVVASVEHLGGISSNLQSCLSQAAFIPQTHRKIDILKMRIVACQQRSHKLALERFCSTTDHFSKHHCRYILPPSTDPAAMNIIVSRDSKDGIESKTQKKVHFETDEPLFLLTHNRKPSLDETVFSHPVLPVRGDGLSILPNSEQSAFHFKETLKLKRSARNWKALHSGELASLIRRRKQIIA